MTLRNFSADKTFKKVAIKNATTFDSVRIRFANIEEWPAPVKNSRTVPFVESYFKVLKSVVGDIKTEYFWVYPSFMHCKEIDFSFIPEQFQQEQIHVWYTTHPKSGLNKEGHVLLIPTKKFKEQMNNIKFLRDFQDINYHANKDLWQPPCQKIPFTLKEWGVPKNQLLKLAAESFTKGRMGNNILDLTKDDILMILKDIH